MMCVTGNFPRFFNFHFSPKVPWLTTNWSWQGINEQCCHKKCGLSHHVLKWLSRAFYYHKHNNFELSKVIICKIIHFINLNVTLTFAAAVHVSFCTNVVITGWLWTGLDRALMSSAATRTTNGVDWAIMCWSSLLLFKCHSTLMLF